MFYFSSVGPGDSGDPDRLRLDVFFFFQKLESIRWGAEGLFDDDEEREPFDTLCIDVLITRLFLMVIGETTILALFTYFISIIEQFTINVIARFARKRLGRGPGTNRDDC